MRLQIAMLAAMALAAPVAARPGEAPQRGGHGATYVSTHWQMPRLVVDAEPPPTSTLADALDEAYRSAPELQARRYDLQATDEDYAQALAELRPTSELQLSGNFARTVPGRLTQSRRSLADQISSPAIETNTLGATVTVDQPLYTGGKASADIAASGHAILAGREQLRGAEGDLFLRVVTAYADIRRDSRVLALRKASVRQLESTFYEVTARRIAGELTRTDIAQASTQVDAAIAMANAAQQQLEQDRSSYTALVGRDPGALAPLPQLPHLPAGLNEALDLALRLNPDLGAAIAAERASRARIAGAAAEGRARLSLRGSARLGGQAVPFYFHNEDQEFTGAAVLTVPLGQGGRVGSLVAQAHDRNAADRIRIEGARRAMVQAVVDAWNGVATAQRNLTVQQAQLESARVLDEGTFAEYRAGLRSTFDVLYAHGSLRDAEIAIEATRRDLYVAQAALLRQLGLLEARTILAGTPLHDPDINTRDVARRGALPWDPAVRALDRVHRPAPVALGIVQPSLPDDPPQMVSGAPMPRIAPATAPSAVPLPGTTGTPAPAHSRRRP